MARAKVALCTPENGLHCVFVAGPYSFRKEIHALHTIALRPQCVCVCLAATVAINRVTRPFEKLSRRSRSRRATKTPWDHDLCPNFQRKVTASSSLAAFTSAPCMYRLFSLLLSPCLLFTAPTFCPGLRCTPRAGFEDGLFKLESETKHTDTGNQGKWVSVGKKQCRENSEKGFRKCDET
jgi:hypothetical protein